MINDINALAESIRDSNVPQWLSEYIARHRERLGAELKIFGECEIPMPDGMVMVVTAKR
jgi:hypothetical protein